MFVITTLISIDRLKAIVAMKNHTRATNEPLNMKMSSLGDCAGCLKEIVKRLIAQEAFEAAIELYQLLGDVTLLTKDYSRALRYFAQAVSSSSSC
jgi:hypothetical protein